MNVGVKGPGMEKEQPFESLVIELKDHVSRRNLKRMKPDAKFLRADVLANWNLATEKPVTTSIEAENPSYPPSRAVDGITGNDSAWHTHPYPQWIMVDLEKNYIIDRVKVVFHYYGGRYYQYTVEVSEDVKKWMQVVDMSKNTAASTREGLEHKFNKAHARYVRLNILKNSANPGVHVNELMVYEVDD